MQSNQFALKRDINTTHLTNEVVTREILFGPIEETKQESRRTNLNGAISVRFGYEIISTFFFFRLMKDSK